MAVVFSFCKPFAAFLWFGCLLKNICLLPDDLYVEERLSTVCRRFCYVLNLTLEELIRQHYSATCTGDLHQPIKGQSRPQLNCCVYSQSCVNQLLHYRVSLSMFSSSMTLLWCRPRHSQAFRPRLYASASTVGCSLLLLLAAGDVEPNPGPHQSLHIGSYNICTVQNKTGSLHDILSDFNLDTLALCEPRIKPGDPPAIKHGFDLDGYRVLHVHKNAFSSRSAGGGLAVVYRNSLTIKPHQLSSTLVAVDVRAPTGQDNVNDAVSHTRQHLPAAIYIYV